MCPRIEDSASPEPFTHNPQQSLRLNSLHKGGKLRPREGKWQNEGPRCCVLFPRQMYGLAVPAERGQHGPSHPPRRAKSGFVHHIPAGVSNRSEQGPRMLGFNTEAKPAMPKPCECWVPVPINSDFLIKPLEEPGGCRQ